MEMSSFPTRKRGLKSHIKYDESPVLVSFPTRERGLKSGRYGYKKSNYRRSPRRNVD